MKLRILVPVKRVVDHQVRPRVKNGLLEASKYSINPFDDIALEQALRWQEKKITQSTHAVTIGPKPSQDILRQCLAKGIQSVSHVETSTDLEPLNVARVLAQCVLKQDANLVIMGKQAIDDDSNCTGQMLAGLLGWAQATNAANIELLDDGRAKVVREVDGGQETLVARLPMVITADLRLAQPRYVKLPSLMKAKRQPIDTVKLESLGKFRQRLETVSITEPHRERAQRMVNSVDELVQAIRDSSR